MSEYKVALEPGRRVRFHEREYTVAGIEAARLHVIADDGTPSCWLVAQVVQAPDYAMLDLSLDAEAAASIFGTLDDLPPAAAAEARRRAACIREAVTGHKSGTPLRRAKGEPRRQYDPELVPTLECRLESMAEEMGLSLRQVQRMKAALEGGGERALVHGNHRKPKRPIERDRRLLDAIEQERQALLSAPRITKKNFRRRVQLRLNASHGKDEVVVPPEATFNRILIDTEQGRSTFGPAKRKRTKAARPTGPLDEVELPVRPGAVLVIDATTFDIKTIDFFSGKPVTLDLLNCVDRYSASIADFRFTSVGSRAIDAVLVLVGAMTGRVFRSDWPQFEPRVFGLPDIALFDERTLTTSPTPGRASQRRSFSPDTVVADHALIYHSAAFENACQRFDITVQLARIKKPTDKPEVESIFNAIKTGFCEHFADLGYKGGDVLDKGEDPEGEAVYFPFEIEERFEWWVENYWQRHVPETIGRNFSPNQMYDMGIARAGRIWLPPMREIYFELLPKVWRGITERGVRIDNLVYTGPILKDLIGKRSAHGGEHKGEWPIAVDSRDLSTAWLKSPESGQWCALRRRGSRFPKMPFNDVMLRQAKFIVVRRGWDPSNDLGVSYVLDEMLELLYSERVKARERRVAVSARHDAGEAARDLRKALAGVDLQDLDPTELDEETDAFELDRKGDAIGVVDYSDDSDGADFLDSLAVGV